MKILKLDIMFFKIALLMISFLFGQKVACVGNSLTHTSYPAYLNNKVQPKRIKLKCMLVWCWKYCWIDSCVNDGESFTMKKLVYIGLGYLNIIILCIIFGIFIYNMIYGV